MQMVQKNWKRLGKKRRIVYLLFMVLFPALGLLGGVGASGRTGLAQQADTGRDSISRTHRIYWANQNNGSGYILSDDNLNLDMTPYNNEKKSAVLRVEYSLGTPSGTIMVPAESVEIRIPLHMFYGRDGNPAPGNSVTVPLAEYPNPTDGKMFNYEIDEEAGEIILRNYAAFDGNEFFYCDIQYNYIPSQIRDGYSEEEYFDITGKEIRAHFNVNIDEDNRYTDTSDRIGLAVHTDAKFNYLSKSVSDKMERWSSSWGKQPSDISDEDYFYVKYGITITTSDRATQPYSIYLEDLYDEDVSDARLVYANYYSNGHFLDNGGWVGNNSDEVLRYIHWDEPNTASRTYYVYVYIAYPRSLLETTDTVTNKVSAVLEGYDEAHDEKQASVNYKYVSIDFVYDGDLFSIAKLPRSTIYATSEKNLAHGGINILEAGKSASVIYSTNSSARALEMLNQTGSYSVELIDDLLLLDGEKLYEGDYSITALSTSYFEALYNGTTQGGNANNDYDTYQPLDIYYKTTMNGEWILAGSVVRTGNYDYLYTYPDGTQKTYINYDVSSTIGQKIDVAHGYIELPEGACGVKIQADGRGIYRLTMGAYLKVDLHPSQHVLNIVKGQSKVILHNISSLAVYDGDGVLRNEAEDASVIGSIKDQVIQHDMEMHGKILQHSWGGYQLTKGDIASEITKTGTRTLDYENSMGYVDFKIVASTTAVPWGFDIQEQIDMGIFTLQQEGVFYDLLPLGSTVDLSSIEVFTHTVGSNRWNVIKTNYTVELVENWQGSGRTMMIVNVSVADPEEQNLRQINYTGASGYTALYYSSFSLWYRMCYPFDSIQDFTSTPTNQVAYRSGCGSLPTGGPAPSAYPYFKALNPEGIQDDHNSDTMYASRQITFNPLEAHQSGFSKKVKAADEPSYGNESEVNPLGTYTYRLRYANQPNTTATGLIMYDILEDYVDPEDPSIFSEWQGNLVSVDTSIAQLKGIDAKVYYSTAAGIDLSAGISSPYADLANPVWTTSPPADLSEVTAIAVDYSTDIEGNPYVIEGGEAVYCYITMSCPENYEEYVLPVRFARNEAYNQALLQNASAPMMEDAGPTEVSMRAPDVEIHKESNPKSGTEENPAEVKHTDSLEYLISVTNIHTADTIQNIVIEDEIPLGLDIQLSDISVYFGNNHLAAELVSASSRVSMTNSGRMLTFTVDRLTAGETVHLIIPTVVQDESVNPGGTVFENTATLVSVGRVELDIDSETTWHKVLEEKVDLIIRKVDAEDDKALEGAEFTLFHCLNEAGSHTHDELAGSNPQCWVEHSVQTSGTDGLVKFTELPVGEYRLAETKAPKGYELPPGQWIINIVSEDDITITAVGDIGNLAVKVATDGDEAGWLFPNQRRYELPLSGGGGLYLLGVCGGMMILAGTLILFKIRRNKREQVI